jgi:hypothetical protein
VSDFIEKISSYNLFNNLLPGVVFCLLADKFFSFSLIQSDIVVGLFFYYFVGLVISRVGSIIVEPLLKNTKIIEFTKYSEYVAASKVDPKLDTLSEVNNMYRTVIALFVALALLAAYRLIEGLWPPLSQFSGYIATILFLAMFVFAYKRQTKYIRDRVLAATSTETRSHGRSEK